jgi:hypothetical protein
MSLIWLEEEIESCSEVEMNDREWTVDSIGGERPAGQAILICDKA